jgi:hypothetical protein
MGWYKILFRLEDFGHNNAHLVSKDYLTHSFFTPLQVDYALSGKEDLISHPDYIQEKPLSTPAVTIGETNLVRRLYTIRNAFVRAHGFKDERSLYPTYGKITYICPGKVFKTYSQIQPTTEVIFIGKKRRVARILDEKEVEAKKMKKTTFTSPDLLTRNQFIKLRPEILNAIPSQRWIFGQFKVNEALKIGDDFFISPLLNFEE